MGIYDRDYMRNRGRDAVRSSTTSRPGTRSPSKTSSTVKGVLLWLAVIVFVTYGFKWLLDGRTSQAFPATGEVAWYVDPRQGPTAPLTIQAPAKSDANFVVLLDHWTSKSPVAMVPVRSGEVARLQVPLGQYRITLVKGTGWQGSERLFGRNLSSREVVHPLNFAMVGNQITGHVIQLETPAGNLETRPSWR